MQVTESFARHLMRVIDGWRVDGFDGVARDYLSRVPRRAAERSARSMIDGDLLDAPDRRGTGLSGAICVKALATPILARSEARRAARCEAVAHHRARSVRHVRVRCAGEAGRMGRVRRLPLLRSGSGDAERKGARGLPQRFSRCPILGLVDAGADRSGDGG